MAIVMDLIVQYVYSRSLSVAQVIRSCDLCGKYSRQI